MKSDWAHLEQFRQRSGIHATRDGDKFGAFYLRRGRVDFVAIASCGDDSVGIPWEHVSIRAHDYKGERVPSWEEMCWAKGLFWDPSECVMQLHPPESDYVNHHPHVLHLWRPTNIDIPRPPVLCV